MDDNGLSPEDHKVYLKIAQELAGLNTIRGTISDFAQVTRDRVSQLQEKEEYLDRFFQNETYTLAIKKVICGHMESSAVALKWGLANQSGRQLAILCFRQSLDNELILLAASNKNFGWNTAKGVLFNDGNSPYLKRVFIENLHSSVLTDHFIVSLLNTIERTRIDPDFVFSLARARFNFDDTVPDSWIVQALKQ